MYGEYGTLVNKIIMTIELASLAPFHCYIFMPSKNHRTHRLLEKNKVDMMFIKQPHFHNKFYGG